MNPIIIQHLTQGKIYSASSKEFFPMTILELDYHNNDEHNSILQL